MIISSCGTPLAGTSTAGRKARIVRTSKMREKLATTSPSRATELETRTAASTIPADKGESPPAIRVTAPTDPSPLNPELIRDPKVLPVKLQEPDPLGVKAAPAPDKKA